MNATASAEDAGHSQERPQGNKCARIQRRFRDLRTGGSGVLRIAATMLSG